MSPITDLLLIGSYAARLRGVLPKWRQGRVGDADFIATPQAASLLFSLFGAEVSEHAPGRAFLDGNGAFDLDVDVSGKSLSAVIGYADSQRVFLNGAEIQCLVARPELILALRHHVTPHSRAKAERDIDDYRSQGITVSAELAEAARAFGPDAG